MQRKVFIQIAACAAAAFVLQFATGCTHRQIDIESQPFFFSHLVDSKTIMETGLAYRKTNQKEDDKNKLRDLLLADNDLLASADDKTIRDLLAKKVTDDFKTGKIAVVNGWILSITEARQCAFFSILQS